MKKLIAILLVVLIFSSGTLAVSANGSENLTEKCTSAFAQYKNYTPSATTYIQCTVLGEIGEYAVFRARIIDTECAYPCICSEQIIGNYKFMHGYIIGPKDNPTGLYVLTPEGEVISALEAFNQNLVTDEALAEIAGGTYYSLFDPENIYKYEEIIVPKLKEEISDPFADIKGYKELYEHYNNKGEPEYVLIYLPAPLFYSMPVADLVGDCVFYGDMGGIPFTYDYGVYVPKTGEIYDLIHAFELEIEGIEKALGYVYYNALMGDCDSDKKLTIKDATYLQKCLAGIEEFRKDDEIIVFLYEENPPARFISDYNRDGERNIKDATAIQKKLAKIA